MSTNVLFLLIWNTRERKRFIVNACLSETGYHSSKTGKAVSKSGDRKHKIGRFLSRSTGLGVGCFEISGAIEGHYMSAKQQFSYLYSENFPLIAFRNAGLHSKGEKVPAGPEEQIHSFNVPIQKGKVESSFCKWKYWQELWQRYEGEFSNPPGF